MKDQIYEMSDGAWVVPSYSEVTVIDAMESYSSQGIAVMHPSTVIEEDAQFDDSYWFWRESWQVGERDVDEHKRQIEIEEFDSMDDFLDSLDD